MPLHVRRATTCPAANVLKSLVQTATLWAIFLVAIPYAIYLLESGMQLPRFDPSPAGIWPMAAFVLFGLVGLWCGYLLSVLGQGTPFPFDATNVLVIAGPYRHVRNPMALLGIGQGICVGLYAGSYLTIVYALAGAFAWNWLARPWEEREMARQFGSDYRLYAENVQCWRPRLLPYRLPSEEREARG